MLAMVLRCADKRKSPYQFEKTYLQFEALEEVRWVSDGTINECPSLGFHGWVISLCNLRTHELMH